MPLEDAISLVDRDFERYCQNVREGRIPPRRVGLNKEQGGQLLTKAAAGEQLNSEQLQSVISALQKQQQNSSPTASVGRPSEPGWYSPCVCKCLCIFKFQTDSGCI